MKNLSEIKLEKEIVLLDETFTLSQLYKPVGLYSYPQILSNSKDRHPLIGIEFIGGVATEDGIRRAEIAITSYRESKGAYSSIPDLSLNDNGFSLDINQVKSDILLGKSSVEIYSRPTVKGASLVWSVVVEKRCEDDTYYRFAVWDIELGAEFLRKSKIQKKGRIYLDGPYERMVS